jgi:hypothetical protein
MKEERNIIMKAYNREPIDGIQNWFISDGEKYYNLHYKEGDNKEKYNSEPDQNYTFEDGV